MSLGSRVIDELAARRELGMYLNYAGYRALRGIDDAAELSEFFRDRGLPNAPITADTKRIADWLRNTTPSDESQNLLTWIAKVARKSESRAESGSRGDSHSAKALSQNAA